MAQLVDVFGFISVLLRGLNLALTSLAVGGLVFTALIVPKGLEQFPLDLECAMRRSRLWIRRTCFVLVVVQAFWLAANSAILMDTTGLSLLQIAGANYFLSGLVIIAVALAIAAYVSRVKYIHAAALWMGGLLIAANVATTHALARLESTAPLLMITALHQGATAVWAGALPYWLFSIKGAREFRAAQLLSRRFSTFAAVGFVCLVSAGLALSMVYIKSPAAIYGTNYGVMVVAKVLLTGLILSLAAFNHRLVRASDGDRITLLARLRTLGEAEIGIAFTVILAAASLTSQPPAVDLITNRVTIPVIADRMAPRLPRLNTPPLASLSPSTREEWKRTHINTQRAVSYIPGAAPSVPPTEGDIAWSEYNHHWAGVVVLIVGVLAVLARSGVAGWAVHWPLAFLGLGLFLLMRADPETWPLGPDGFWESFSSADVAQHRLFVALIGLFAVFEWSVQTGRMRSPKAALVFPGVCALGGALLMTHTHALSNVREELLAELSHLPLAILGVAAGWARWLELRLPKPDRLIPSWIWPICFVLIGVVLLLYREA